MQKPSYDISFVIRAIEFAAKKHRTQRRKDSDASPENAARAIRTQRSITASPPMPSSSERNYGAELRRVSDDDQSPRLTDGRRTFRGPVATTAPHSLRELAPKSSIRIAERPEPRTGLGSEKLRLIPGGKVPAFVDLVVTDEIGIARSIQLRGA